MHDLLPDNRVVFLDLTHLAEDAGAVHQPVEAAEVFLQLLGERQVDAALGVQKIHRCEDGLRPAIGDDLIVDGGQLFLAAAEQYDRRAFAPALDGERLTDAVAGTGDENGFTL